MADEAESRSRPSRRPTPRAGSRRRAPPAAREPASCASPTDTVARGQRPSGEAARVGIVVARFNGEITSALLESALAELDERASRARP